MGRGPPPARRNLRPGCPIIETFFAYPGMIIAGSPPDQKGHGGPSVPGRVWQLWRIIDQGWLMLDKKVM